MKTCKRCQKEQEESQFRSVTKTINQNGEKRIYPVGICRTCENAARQKLRGLAPTNRPTIMPGEQRTKRRANLIEKHGYTWMGKRWLICELADEKGCCEVSLRIAIKKHGIDKAMLMPIKTREVDYSLSKEEKEKLADLTIADAIQRSRSSTIWSFLCSVPPPVFDESETLSDN